MCDRVIHHCFSLLISSLATDEHRAKLCTLVVGQNTGYAQSSVFCKQKLLFDGQIKCHMLSIQQHCVETECLTNPNAFFPCWCWIYIFSPHVIKISCVCDKIDFQALVLNCMFFPKTQMNLFKLIQQGQFKIHLHQFKVTLMKL